MVASFAGARTAPRFLRLPEPAAENEENSSQGDNAFCSGRKMSSRGRRMGGVRKVSRSCRCVSGKGAIKIVTSPSFSSHPIMRRPDADLEEKREPRVVSSAGAQKGDRIKPSGRSLTLA